MKISKELINKVDSGNMWGLMSDFPKHWKEVMKLTEDVELNIDRSRIKIFVLQAWAVLQLARILFGHIP